MRFITRTIASSSGWQLRGLLAATAVAVLLASPASADITGKIKLDGKPPAPVENAIAGVAECAAQHPDGLMDDTVVCNAKGELANVLVSIKSDDPKSLGGTLSKEPVILGQKGCMYSPHILPMMLGQELRVSNDDPFVHNVQSISEINEPFGFTQPNKDPGQVVKEQPTKPETIKVKCAVHTWMIAYVVVLPHPFFSVSKEDGTFSIKGLKDGEYTLQAWHERYGTETTKITVKDGKAEANFTFKQFAEKPDETNVRLASLKLPTKEAETCPDCDAATSSATTKPAELVSSK